MTDELATLLARATVRIDVDGQVSGTGCLVAPGRVLTCHHVIKQALDRPGGQTIIGVVGPRGPDPTSTPVTAVLTDVTNDLALLTVDLPGAPPPVVSLGDTPRIGDELYAYGYPPRKPEGTSGTFRYEGPEGGPPLLHKLKAGQVQPGLSGAPLLDLRTGTVVGVIRRTRNADTDLGGLAVPIEVVLDSFDRLRRDNADAVARDRRWVERMTQQQRAALGRHDGGPRTARLLVVDIGQRAAAPGDGDERWTVSLSSPSSDLEWGDEIRVDLNTLRPDVARLFRMLKATNRSSEKEQSQAVGRALAKALWTDDVQQRLRTLLAAEDQVLDVVLHFRDDVDEDLRYLPWEALQLAPATRSRTARPVWLGTTRGATLVRAVDLGAPGPAAPGAFRAVVFRSFDEGGHLVDVARRVAELASGVGPTTLEPADDGHPTRLALRKVLETSPTLVHVVARGRTDGSDDLIDLDAYPEPTRRPVDAEELADVFRFDVGDGVDPPTLVVLHAVRASESEQPPDMTVFAHDLLDVGVRAVLAFPLPVDDEAATTFFDAFYSRLRTGSSLQTAVQRGREALARWDRYWSFPALVTRDAHPVVLRPPATRTDQSDEPDEATR